MRTHWNIMEGKLFVGFLALILRSDMLHKIKSNDHTKDLTFGKIIIELRKIKSVTLADHREMLISLTKMQETLLAANVRRIRGQQNSRNETDCRTNTKP